MVETMRKVWLISIFFNQQLLNGSVVTAFTVIPRPSPLSSCRDVLTRSVPGDDSVLEAAQQQQRTTTSSSSSLRLWSTLGNSDLELLQKRVQDMRIAVWEEEMARPPNPKLSPTEFVSAILEALKSPDDPVPDSGLRMLLRASTKNWRSQVYQAIGIPPDLDTDAVSEDVAASALGNALARPKNQFGILVGAEDSEEYYLDISSSNELDFHDGSCFVDCRLRQKDTDTLLAVLGWELEQRLSDNAWVVDGIQWQDFRDEFRPGIGREEWMRICG